MITINDIETKMEKVDLTEISKTVGTNFYVGTKADGTQIKLVPLVNNPRAKDVVGVLYALLLSNNTTGKREIDPYTDESLRNHARIEMALEHAINCVEKMNGITSFCVNDIDFDEIF